MSIETGVVLAKNEAVLQWHLPPGRTGGSLPDSPDLWQVLWANRDNLYGFAHSHPGSGPVAPSWEDLTTFSAIDRALGKRLVWPITSSDHVAFFTWKGPGPYVYAHAGQFTADDAPDWLPPDWLSKLRELSNFEK
jgi:hypothetical protein